MRPAKWLMVLSFKVHGIEVTLIECTIHIALKPSKIEGEMLNTIEGMRILEGPILFLTNKGLQVLKDEMFQPLQDMGHHGGVNGYCAKLEKDI